MKGVWVIQMSKRVMVYIFMCITLAVSNIEGAVTFEKTLGGTQDDEAYSVTVTPSNTYIIGGRSKSFGSGNWDAFASLVNRFGNPMWQSAYALNDREILWSVRWSTTTNHPVAAGATNSVSANMNAFFLGIKNNNTGAIKGTPELYGGANLERAYAMEPTSGGNFVIAGETSSLGAGGKDIFVMETTPKGNVIWSFTYGTSSGNEVARTIQQTADGGYIVGGWTDYYGNKKILLLKITSAGNLVWSKIYGGFGNEIARSVTVDANGNIVVTGWTTSWNGISDIYLMKVDATGNLLWFNTYGGANSDAGKYVEPTPDGGFIIAGNTRSYATGGNFHDGILIKTDGAGNILWTKTYGGTGDDRFEALAVAPDGGFIVVGTSNSFSIGGDYDIYIVKTDNAGVTGCENTIAVDFVSRFILQESLSLLSHPGPLENPFSLSHMTGGTSNTVCPRPPMPFNKGTFYNTQSLGTTPLEGKTRIRVSKNIVYISPPSEYKVFRSNGSLVKSGESPIIRFEQSGIYFIKIGQEVHKVSIIH